MYTKGGLWACLSAYQCSGMGSWDLAPGLMHHALAAAGPGLAAVTDRCQVNRTAGCACQHCAAWALHLNAPHSCRCLAAQPARPKRGVLVGHSGCKDGQFKRAGGCAGQAARQPCRRCAAGAVLGAAATSRLSGPRAAAPSYVCEGPAFQAMNAFYRSPQMGAGARSAPAFGSEQCQAAQPPPLRRRVASDMGSFHAASA
jgi:hypothetical protein